MTILRHMSILCGFALFSAGVYGQLPWGKGKKQHEQEHTHTEHKLESNHIERQEDFEPPAVFHAKRGEILPNLDSGTHRVYRLDRTGKDKRDAQ